MVTGGASFLSRALSRVRLSSHTAHLFIQHFMPEQQHEIGMNYYSLHIGDYLKDTVHLSMLEDAAYRRMLDLYYASEKPLPLDLGWLCRLVRADSAEERAAVEFVLQHFFQKFEDGWRNKRADVEIKLSYKRAKVARSNGKKGGRPKTHRVISGLSEETQTKPDGKLPYPNPISHIPNPKKIERSRGSRLPSDWVPSEILTAWACKERPDLTLEAVIPKFRDYWSAVPGNRGVKLDWEATFRNFIRTEKPGAKGSTPDYSAVIAEIAASEK